MSFNHYAKIKKIIEKQPSGWIIKKINIPTMAKNFKGETVKFDYFYRIYDTNDKPIKYCKFQQIELLSKILKIPTESLPIIEEDV